MGPTFVTLNVHSLIHLSSNCSHLQMKLDEFSSFRFESYLGKLKGMIRSPNRPARQLSNRVIEYEEGMKVEPDPPMVEFCNQTYNMASTLSQFYTDAEHFRKVRLNRRNLVISTKFSDHCCLLKSGVVIFVRGISRSGNGDSVIHVQKFQRTAPYYVHPCDSRENGVFLCDDLSEFVASINVSEILNKCICFPLPCNKFLALVLL